MVSGATRGIGKAIAAELARNGFALSLGARRPSALPAELMTPDTLAVPYDATDRGGEQRWVDATLARFGRIDALVNSAGILRQVGLEGGLDGDLDALMEVNVHAPFRLIRAALPHLKASGQGRVANISSMSGKRVMGLNAGYQMSKHAVVALTHAVRRIGWEHGIRATAICPGYVDTDMVAGVATPRAEMTRPEDLARLVVCVMMLPNTAGVAELLVNNRYEHML
jgi:NAD(P)-dependent dehydrogenase (short-subunit alcohol dehydrogenase family)